MKRFVIKWIISMAALIIMILMGWAAIALINYAFANFGAISGCVIGFLLLSLVITACTYETGGVQ